VALGKRIRDLRIEKKLKVIDVAKKTGLTSSTISQVERGIISPSIDTLKKIGDALNIPIGSLFEETDNSEQNTKSTVKILEKSPVVHENQRKTLSPSDGIKYYLLNPDMSGPIEFIYDVSEAGSSSGDGLYNHKGYECGLVLEGQIEVQVGDKIYILNKGDSITFCSEEMHRKRNIGKTRAVSVWANTPPWF